MVKKYDLHPWDKFNRLTILWEREYRGRQIYEKCLCECWKEKWIPRWNIVSWITKSCWCFKIEADKRCPTRFKDKHWMSRSRIYKIFDWIKRRVRDKNHVAYKYYWWKWVKCEWNSFEDFYRDMWESYNDHVAKFWEKNTTIDRMDWNWNYCKENCRRATWREQRLNKEDCKKNNQILFTDNIWND